jgi:alpha-glucosidase/glucan 1,6-alpha-glucosidase
MSSPWWKNASIYQIYPASFKDTNGDGIGDLPGILSKLDYIKSLGVDSIWICPMYDSPQYDMGYDISNYEEVYAPYGTVADVEAIIAACHERGLRILLDLVINHTSYLHAWFKESRSSKSSPKRDWYIWRPAKYDADRTRRPPNNWRSYFGGSAWAFDDQTQEYYLHLFAAQQPDLNWENPETRKAIYDSAVTFWLEKGIDGFRVDTVNMYSKMSFVDAPVIDERLEWQPAHSLFCNGPRIHEFLLDLGQILAKYDAMTVGELPHTPEIAEVLSYVSAKEKKLSMVFQFDVVEVGTGDPTFNTKPRNWTLPELRKRIAQTQELVPTDGWSTSFLENHDQARSISRWGNEETPENWALSAKMLAILVTTLSGTVYIYQGQEIGMVNFPLEWDIEEYKDVNSINYYKFIQDSTQNDPAAVKKAKEALAHLARDHSRIPMQWDGTANAGFTTESAKPWMRVHDEYPTLNVEKQQGDSKSVLAFWKEALRVRKSLPKVFAHGVFGDTDPSDECLFVFEKTGDDQKLLVLLNFTAEAKPIDIAERLGNSPPKAIIKNYEDEPLDFLRPLEGRVYLFDK